MGLLRGIKTKMRGWRGRVAAAAVIVVAVAVVVSQAAAHIERASYWPNPAADRSVTPPAGGKVPKARSLSTALRKGAPGTTRVVCQSSSVPRLKKAISKARTRGYKLRPSERTRHISAAQGRKLLAFNRKLKARCKYESIQDAVTASGNNDRVVIMPGLYTEPKSRAAPTQDPKCADLKQVNDRQVDTGANQSGAVSYAYQVKCPNDQNLIAVIGRANGTGSDPQPPLDDRHGIPNIGPCIRCNLQIEGSGVGPDDVIVDGGRVASGNHGPIGAAKDVGIRVDRADGFVLRNMTVRHVNEHDIYVLESDGYRLERFKTFYAGEYGVLTFVEDHGLIQQCDASGHGDSALYPGAGAEGGDQRTSGPRRYTQEIRFCDMHHSAAGYSGTDGNSVWVHHNDFYDNALGFTTDVFTAAGHPGFPQDSDLVEHNEFYSNNFNVYAKDSDVEPTHPRAGRHRPLDRGRQPQHHSQEPLLEQLEAGDHAVRGARRVRLQSAGAPGRAVIPMRPTPRTTTGSTGTSWAAPRRTSAIRTAPTSGGTPTRRRPATAGTTTSVRRAPRAASRASPSHCRRTARQARARAARRRTSSSPASPPRRATRPAGALGS